MIYFLLSIILILSPFGDGFADTKISQEELNQLEADIKFFGRIREKLNTNPETWYCVRQSQVEVFYDRAERYEHAEKFTMRFNGDRVQVKCPNCYLRDHTSDIWHDKKGGWSSDKDSLRLKFSQGRLSAVGLYPQMSHAVVYFADCEKF